jgi:hypothetical protein
MRKVASEASKLERVPIEQALEIQRDEIHIVERRLHNGSRN